MTDGSSSSSSTRGKRAIRVAFSLHSATAPWGPTFSVANILSELLYLQGKMDFALERAVRTGESAGEIHRPLFVDPGEFGLGNYQARIRIVAKLAEISAVGDTDRLRDIPARRVAEVAVGVGDGYPI